MFKCTIPFKSSEVKPQIRTNKKNLFGVLFEKKEGGIIIFNIIIIILKCIYKWLHEQTLKTIILPFLKQTTLRRFKMFGLCFS